MAKALLGYVGTTDPYREHEIAVLRRRVGDLEAEILRLKSENDALQSSLSADLSPEDLLAPSAH